MRLSLIATIYTVKPSSLSPYTACSPWNLEGFQTFSAHTAKIVISLVVNIHKVHPVHNIAEVTSESKHNYYKPSLNVEEAFQFRNHTHT